MPEKVSPLMALARRLLERGVPSLSSLVAQISDAESYAEFVNMVKRYLPEQEQEILHEPTPMAQVACFASHFEDRYFPLEDAFKYGGVEGYEDLTWHIPLVVMGFSYDDYHEVHDWRPGALLMTYLIESPWGDDDIHVSMAEACVEYVPAPLIERAGRVQLSPESAHSLLKGTRYEPLALWADRIHFNTGNFFLDTDYEMLCNSMEPEWSPENVRELTRQWHQAEAHDNKTGEFIEWLEEDLPGHFEELVSFIEERKADEKKAHR